MGRIAVTAHPRSGPRTEPDEIANVTQAVFPPAGTPPSRFAGTEFLQIEQQFFRGGPQLFSFVSVGGLSAEFPFGTETSLLHIQTDQPHPVLGHGLFVRNSFRLGTDITDAQRESLAINAAEIEQADQNFLGSWVWRDGALHFVTFVPNHLAKPNVLTNFFLFAAARAKYAERFVPLPQTGVKQRKRVNP